MAIELSTSRATFIDSAGGCIPAFLCARQKKRKQECFALQLIQQQGGIPAPQFLGLLQVNDMHLLIQSYIEGVDLATLLPPSQERPPLPMAVSPHDPVAKEALFWATQELGTALRRLHHIKLPCFGKLAGDDPNPFRVQARGYTRQEGYIALERCQQEGWLDRQEGSWWDGWLEEHVCLLDEGEPAYLVHGDLHVSNVRLAQEMGGWRLSGVIDFEHARAWCPEFDLVLLRWHLWPAGLWQTLLEGYGHVPDDQRMHLFEVIKLLVIMSGRDPEAAYAQWAQRKLCSLKQC